MTKNKPSGDSVMQPRRRRFIKPAFQGRLILVFLSMACMAVLLQASVLNWGLARVARDLPNDGDLLLSRIPEQVLVGMLVATAALVPAMVMVGIMVTFRIAGPIHHFEMHLRQLIRGERPGRCSIRSKDEFQELCGLINECVEALDSDAADRSVPDGRVEGASGHEGGSGLLPASTAKAYR